MNESITVLSLMVALASIGLIYGFWFFSTLIWRFTLWSRTQEIPPAKGQVWNQHGARLFVIDVHAIGKTICIRLRSYGNKEKNEWEETLDAWKERVKYRHLYLMQKETLKFTASLSKDNGNGKSD